MQDQKLSLAPGAIIGNRYMINDLLGEGGFSAVYLVHDMLAAETCTDDRTSLFALKELRYQSRQEKVRFASEAELLKKLDHPALPHFYRIFEDHSRSQEFILLEYIQGPNLEVLRRQQPHKRFTTSEAFAILQPIFEAITYLHHQYPPIMHRDVKPANIIVSTTKKGAVLVDFGIAKEYETDSTTTAIRHCSPGYGAPEQYSGYGTDIRTDVYGLGATCYTLLTGTVPIDAFHRTTTLISKKRDPLVSINDIVADVPVHITQAIECAMSIGQESRFSTAQEFWLALHASTSEHFSQKPEVHTAVSSKASQAHINQEFYQPQLIERSPQRMKSIFFIFLCVTFLLLIAGGLNFRSHIAQRDLRASMPTSQVHAVSTSLHSTPTLSSAHPYLNVSYMYKGTIHDLITGNSTEMSLTKISQSNERISGIFIGLHLSATFVGVLDNSQHIFFTVKGNTGHHAIFFEGAVRTDGNLAGNYCDIDGTGQCVGNYGLWSVAPSNT